MHMPPWAARAARALVGERASRIYLVAVAACTALTLAQTAFSGGPGLSFGGVLLELATLPWTPALWRLFAVVGGLDAQAAAGGWTGWALTVVAAMVSAGIDAVLIGYATRAARGRVATR
jgi:hypothetical protein